MAPQSTCIRQRLPFGEKWPSPKGACIGGARVNGSVCGHDVNFAIGKPFVRQPRGDTRVTPEDKRRAVAQRAAEIAERRAVFDANNNN